MCRYYVFLIYFWFHLKTVRCDQYFNSYYSFDLDAVVECYGNPDVEPYCVKSGDPNGDPNEDIKLYRESDFSQIPEPIPTEIDVERRRRLVDWEGALLKHNENNGPATCFQNLVLLIRFPEHRERFLFDPNDFALLFNGEGVENRQIIPTGSIKDFYMRQTYGKIVINSTIVGWVDIKTSEEQAAGGCSSLCRAAQFQAAVQEALEKVDDEGLLDFRHFDSNGDKAVDIFTVLTSSAAAESHEWYDNLGVGRLDRIWSHKYVLPTEFVSKNHSVRIRRYSVSPAFYGANPNMKHIGRIGVISHEIGHFLGLGDFYDTSYKSSGLHVYDTMSNSWGIAGTQLLPNNFSPRNKQMLNVVKLKTPKVGRNLIRPSNGESDNEIYALSGEAFDYDPKETIYIDYWKNEGYSLNHPGGILIYHADERVTTGNRKPYYPKLRTVPHDGNHYQVRLIQADGKYELERVTWPKRHNPGVFWNTPDLNLSDFGDNNLMSWAQLEMTNTSACRTTGNMLYGFKQLGNDTYEFYYDQVPQRNCYN